jgi:hypothetical protein
VALLGQTLFPHVHAQPRSHWLGARTAALAHCDAECPTALTAASGASHPGDDGDRHGTSCPLCRAQSDARSSLLPSSLVLPAPAAVVSAFTADAVAAVSTTTRSLAAPRAPPFAS